jgi:hypothetical protein
MKIDKNNLANIISIILQNKDAFEELKKDFPEILADLTTFRENPNCSCRGRVTKYFNEKIVAGNESIFDKYVDHRLDLIKDINSVNSLHSEKILSGKIIKIGKNEEDWNNLWRVTSGKVFRSFSTIEKEDAIHVYFL